MNVWKFLISGGLLGLLFTSVLMLIVLYRLSPRLQSTRQLSLRDQHINYVPRYGGVAMFWGFVITLSMVWWFPFEQRGLGLQFLSHNRLVGLCLGGLTAWGLGFADDIILLRVRWKLIGQAIIGLMMILFGTMIKLLHTI